MTEPNRYAVYFKRGYHDGLNGLPKQSAKATRDTPLGMLRIIAQREYAEGFNARLRDKKEPTPKSMRAER